MQSLRSRLSRLYARYRYPLSESQVHVLLWVIVGLVGLAGSWKLLCVYIRYKG
jgi:hypothetical protein